MPNIPLTAVLNAKNEVEIQGNGGDRLRRDSGAHMFIFDLDDQTNLGVEFLDEQDLLIAEDDTDDCPPTQNNTSQIDQVRRVSATRAMFRDRNDNKKEDMPVTYELRFRCTRDPNQQPTFDPTIINGGRT